jgi:hypothetical protein
MMFDDVCASLRLEVWMWYVACMWRPHVRAWLRGTMHEIARLLHLQIHDTYTHSICSLCT